MKKLFVITIACFSTILLFGQAKSLQPTKTQEQRLNEEYCTGLFKSADGTIIDLETEINSASALGYTNILNWLNSRVSGLRVVTLRSGLRVPVIRGQIAGIFVDEMQVSASFLNALSVDDIAIIKVIKSPFLGGVGGSAGAIAIYTKRGEEEEGEEQ